MFGMDAAEFADKMGDHVVITAGTATSGIASEVLHVLPRELMLFFVVAFFMVARLGAENIFHRHHNRKIAAEQAAEARRLRAHPAKSRVCLGVRGA